MKKLINSAFLVLVLFCLDSINAAIIDIGVGDEFSYVYIDNSDVLTMNGGLVHDDIRCYGNSTATFNYGTVRGLDGSVFAEEVSTVYIYGGELKTGLHARDNSHIYIYGGEFGELSGNGLDASDSAVIDIFGYNFLYTEYPSDGLPDIHLSGSWENGTAFDIRIGSYEPYTDLHINLHVIPEPCSLVLLSVGGLMLRCRKRKP